MKKASRLLCLSFLEFDRHIDMIKLREWAVSSVYLGLVKEASKYVWQ